MLSWKLQPDGVKVIKGRLCLKEFMERLGTFTETYSPTADRESHSHVAMLACFSN